MNNAQLLITAGLFGLLLLLNQLAGARPDCANCYGGLPWYGWAGGLTLILVAFLASSRAGGERLRALFAPRRQPARQPPEAVAQEAGAPDEKWNESLRRKYDWDGPEYPHPVIIAERCIGCHACVEACPHDVLTIAYTERQQPVASVVDPDLCMEDTSCEAACPVTPKACVVVNTAKLVKKLPAPVRDRAYMSSVSGCYVVGDASGTPLIKNAANEGREVVVHLANELRAERSGGTTPAVDYEVAIIGAGPAGLSAAVTAQRLGLKFVCVERATALATIERTYSANKYVYFKPETTEWAGGIHLPSLEEYVEEVLEEFLDPPHKRRAAELLAGERDGTPDKAALAALRAARARYRQLLDAELKGEIGEGESESLARARGRFAALLEEEEKYNLARLIRDEAEARARGEELAPADRAMLEWARRAHGERLPEYLAALSFTEDRFQRLARERRRVAGEQKELLINTWRMNARESGVRVNEGEECTSAERAADGDYFVIRTRREGRAGPDGAKEGPVQSIYRARRVVVAVGSGGSPTKLRVKNATMKVRRGGEARDKVLYHLSDPRAFTGLNLIVVGGGNSAVEAAVDLVCWRQGDEIRFRAGAERNKVTVLVRSPDFRTDVKFGNKQQLYQCVEAGLIEVRRNTEIVEIREGEVVTANLTTGRENPPIPNDFVFAMIGSERPAALLTRMKVKMTG